MTGLRVVSKQLGLLGYSPPEAVLARIDDSPAHTQDPVVVQLAHWTYGAAAGAAFAALPRTWQEHQLAPAGYGLAAWLAFRAGIAPLLHLHDPARAHHQPALVLDHLLFGYVVADRLPQR